MDSKIEDKMKNLEIGKSIDEVFEVLRRSNKYIDETMPWSLAKDESKKDRLNDVLYNLLESIRICAVYLESFIPTTANDILSQLNTLVKSTEFGSVKEYNVNEAKILFQRIDKNK